MPHTQPAEPTTSRPQAPRPRILFTDLDGTLFGSDRRISEPNQHALQQLAKAGVVRVVATGRSLYSFRTALPEKIGADYLIFSSGAGVIDLATGELLFSANLQLTDVVTISRKLAAGQVDFMVHGEVPHNHHFTYHEAGGGNADFTRRIAIYRDFATPFDSATFTPAPAAQIIAVLPHDELRFTSLATQLADYQVTRTTSPLDHHSMWMEIGPAGIHKGSSAAWLCDYLGICHRATVAVGNDYNDIDLLDFCQTSFLVANGPPELRTRYQPAPGNDHNGFSVAVQQAFFSP